MAAEFNQIFSIDQIEFTLFELTQAGQAIWQEIGEINTKLTLNDQDRQRLTLLTGANRQIAELMQLRVGWWQNPVFQCLLTSINTTTGSILKNILENQS